MKDLKGKLIILVLLAIAISSIKATIDLFGKNDQLAEAEKELAQVKKEQEELERQKEQISSQEFIEREARDKLGLAKPGETIVVLPDKEILRKLAPKFDDEDYFLPPKPIWRRWVELFF